MSELRAFQQDYGFDYSDDDQMQDEGSADVENQYYTAKSKKEDSPEAALKLFKAIVDNEETKGDWYVLYSWTIISCSHPCHFIQGASKRSNSLQNYSSLFFIGPQKLCRHIPNC